MARKRSQQCTALIKDGSRCSRFCAPGMLVCARHEPNAKLIGVAAQHDTDDTRALLKRLTRDRDPAIRLRAVTELLKVEEREASGSCPTCSANAERGRDADYILARALDTQKAELLSLLRQVKNLKCIIAAQPVRPVDSDGNPLIELAPPTDHRKPFEPAPPLVREPAKPRAVEPPPVPHVVIPREDYDDLGLVEVRGVLTSTLGDEYVEDLRSGRISLADAKAQRARAVKHFSGARP